MSHHAHSPLLSPARQAGPTASPARQAGPTLRLHAPEADTSPPEPSLDWTWPAFFARYVKPRMRQEVHSRKRRTRGIEPYREAVVHWKRLTRNPTLGSTTREDCDAFVRRLFRLRGRRGAKTIFRWSPKWRSWLRVKPQPADVEELLARHQHDYRMAPQISQNTVHKICNQMESIFRWAGPASKRFRQAADLFVGADRDGRLRRLPWLDSPTRGEGQERVFARAELLRWIDACSYAQEPRIEGVAPADWWRALIRVIYYTGLRIGTALAARYSWIVEKEGDRWLDVPVEAMKAQRAEAICLKPQTMAALESLRRPGRDVIFAWAFPASGSHQQLYQECERLQELAGIPPERRFRFHAIRACAGDTLYDLDPEMAREALCHKDLRTTEASYTRKATRSRRRAAAAAMPELDARQGQKTLFDRD